MDNSNWGPIQGGEPSAMDTVDWRTQFPPDSRQRVVNKIIDTLKKHLPVSGQEGLQELKKIAEKFEEKIYSAATSQSDYLRKISLKMLTMETKFHNRVPNSMPNNQVGSSNRPPDQASLYSTSWTGHPNGGEWQEEVYLKIKQMKEQYLSELSETSQKIANKLMQDDSLPERPKSEQFEKIKFLQAVLDRSVMFSEVPKSSIQPGYKEKMVSYEKQIINFANANKPRKTVPQMQQQ